MIGWELKRRSSWSNLSPIHTLSISQVWSCKGGDFCCNAERSIPKVHTEPRIFSFCARRGIATSQGFSQPAKEYCGPGTTTLSSNTSYAPILYWAVDAMSILSFLIPPQSTHRINNWTPLLPSNWCTSDRLSYHGRYFILFNFEFSGMAAARELLTFTNFPAAALRQPSPCPLRLSSSIGKLS